MLQKGETKDFIDLDMDFLSRTRQRSPDPWGTSQPHNTFDELSIPERLVIGVKNRLDAKILTKDSVYHPSFLVSPIQIKPDPANMVTLDTLKKKFGASWQPTCSELNATEKQCKVTWGGPSRKVRRSKRSVIVEMLTLESHRLQRVRQAPLHLPKSISTLQAISLADLRAEPCRSQFAVLYLCATQIPSNVKASHRTFRASFDTLSDLFN